MLTEQKREMKEAKDMARARDVQTVIHKQLYMQIHVDTHTAMHRHTHTHTHKCK